MKGILLWLVGLPIPIIIVLYLIGILWRSATRSRLFSAAGCC